MANKKSNNNGKKNNNTNNQSNHHKNNNVKNFNKGKKKQRVSNEVLRMKEDFKNMIDDMSEEEFIDFSLTLLTFFEEIDDGDFDEFFDDDELFDFDEDYEDVEEYEENFDEKDEDDLPKNIRKFPLKFDNNDDIPF